MDRTFAAVLSLVLVVPVFSAAVGAGTDTTGHATTGSIGTSPQGPLPAATSDVLEDGLAEELDDGPHGVIVHLEDRSSLEALSSIDGLDVRYTFQNLPAVYAIGTPAAVETLASRTDVRFVEDAWKPLEFHLNSATTASRAREVFDPSFTPPDVSGIDEPSPPQLDEDGDPIDGEGVGIAVVDSGIDARHPGLDEGKVVRNFVVTPTGPVEAGDYTESGRGHGTRLAGIAAGTGEGSISSLDLRGAAPGASLYGFATSPRDRTVRPAIAFDWILANADDQTPPIEIVLNGWSCADAHCGHPGQAHLELARDLAEAGILVVFPAGNSEGSGGSGLRTQTTTEATLQTPGILGVSTYDDGGAGSRGLCIHESSSRGNAFEPTTWPDLAAPGDDVQSPQALAANPDTRRPGSDGGNYNEADEGSSLAAAHAAGVAALVEQAHDGDLSADDLEYILEVTAHEPTPLTGDRCPKPFVRADPANPWDAANFAAGHGLVDAMDAVDLGENFTGQPDSTPSLETIPGNFTHLPPVFASGAQRLYLAGDSGFRDQAPQDAQPKIRVLQPGSDIMHTTDPFQENRTVSAAFAEIWVGTPNEYVSVRCAVQALAVSVHRIDAETDEATLLGSNSVEDRFLAPGGPWLRTISVPFDGEVTFSSGDRLRLTLSTDAHAADCLDIPGTATRLVYSGADDTPSRLRLGQRTQEIRPDTFEACLTLEGPEAPQVGCAWVGGQREHVPLNCQLPPIAVGVPTGYHVEWFGPPGSGIVLNCHGATTACVVPGVPGDPWGKCESSSVTNTGAAHSTCTYFTRSGEEVAGHGLCRIGT